MSLNKFINPPSDKPFHSNQYAEEARSGQIGSTNSQTFSQRSQVEKNRRAIREYRDSLVARGHRHPTHQQVPIDVIKPTGRESLQVGNRQAINAKPHGAAPGHTQKSTPPKASFSEPSSRGYNPYS